LENLEVMSKTGQLPRAELTLNYKGESYRSQSEGDGPVDAAFKAIEKLAKSETELKLYSVNAVTAGTDSQGEVTVRLEKGGRIVNGQGADTDVLVASVKAYLHALNLIENPDRLHPQLDGV
jgi:2-isopropylmalate synthase